MFFTFTLPAVQEAEPDIDRLVNEYSNNLTRLCYMLLKDIHLAEDAAWETLYKAYKGYRSFRKDCTEKTWITRIAINVCNGYMRKPSYSEVAGSDIIPLDYASDDEASLELRSVESITLLNAVYKLPDIYRQVILLRYYQQLNNYEICKILSIKSSTVSVRMRRAHDMLKEILKEA